MRTETERLIIRPIQRGDEIVFTGMAKDGSLLQIGFEDNCCEWIDGWITEAEGLTAKDDPRVNYIPCTVVLKATGEVIGSVGSTYYEDTDEIGLVYFAGADYRGKGYITEAVKAYIPFFFEHYNEPKIKATILDSNTASQRVAEKSGFQLLEKKMYKDIDDEEEELYRFYVMRREGMDIK